MAPKIITVVEAHGRARKRRLASEEAYRNLVKKLGVESLIDQNEQFLVEDFESLDDGGTYILPPALEPTVTLELSLKKKTRICSWKKEDLAMASLELTARKMFDVPLARLAFALQDDEPLDNDSKLDSIPTNKTTKVKVMVTRVGFSSVTTVKQALQLLHLPGDSIPVSDAVFPNPFNIDNDNEELLHAVSTLQRLREVAPLPHGCEATRRLYIDPILLAAARVAGGILLEVEKEYENRDVYGPIDYIFKYNEETICVTEGKKDQIDKGVVQNIAQLAAVADDRKRKISEISQDDKNNKPIYGIATTYLNWAFLVLKEGKVAQSSIHGIKDADKEDVGGIIGRIVSILKSGKG